MAAERQSLLLSPVPVRRRDKPVAVTPISDVIVTVWREIVTTLQPVIGPRGVAALYERTLDLNVPAFPWLAGMVRDVQAVAVDLTALRDILITRPEVDAADCGRALVKTFQDLLATLIGRALTEQLFRSIPAPAVINPARTVASS